MAGQRETVWFVSKEEKIVQIYEVNIRKRSTFVWETAYLPSNVIDFALLPQKLSREKLFYF